MSAAAYWEDRTGLAIERELARRPDARRRYDTDRRYRLSLALLADHLAVFATVMEDAQGFPRFSVDDTLLHVITAVVVAGADDATAREDHRQTILDALDGHTA